MFRKLREYLKKRYRVRNDDVALPEVHIPRPKK